MKTKTTRANEIILGRSGGIQRLCKEIESLAQSALHSVLVVGETGVGKDLVPQALAACAPNAVDPIEVFNCPAIPVDHLESELFGTTRGAFPGSMDRAGAAERAAGGMLFLDEIAAMPLIHQGKVLRLLESGEGRRLGAGRPYRTDAMVMAATNEDLQRAVRRGAFREDLYYRLAQDAVLRVPPLRERVEDIPILASCFLSEIDAWASLEASALEELAFEAWPGNVRQLRAVVRSAFRLAGPGCPVHGIHVREALERIAGVEPRRDVPKGGLQSMAASPPLRGASASNEVALVAFYAADALQRRQMLIDALHSARGNQTQAGIALGLHRTRHGSEGGDARKARKLAERKFRYWWHRLVGPRDLEQGDGGAGLEGGERAFAAIGALDLP